MSEIKNLSASPLSQAITHGINNLFKLHQNVANSAFQAPSTIKAPFLISATLRPLTDVPSRQVNLPLAETQIALVDPPGRSTSANTVKLSQLKLAVKGNMLEIWLPESTRSSIKKQDGKLFWERQPVIQISQHGSYGSRPNAPGDPSKALPSDQRTAFLVPGALPEDAGRLLRAAARSAGGIDALISRLAKEADTDRQEFDAPDASIGLSIRQLVALADETDKLDAIKPDSPDYANLSDAKKIIWQARQALDNPQSLSGATSKLEADFAIKGGARPAWLEPLTQIGNEQLIRTVLEAAKESKVDFKHLWITMVGEGAAFTDWQKNMKTTGIDPASKSNVHNSFESYGLDNWRGRGGLEEELRAGGLLPSGLDYDRTGSTSGGDQFGSSSGAVKNEQGQTVYPAKFNDIKSAVRASAAVLKLYELKVTDLYPGARFTPGSLFYNTYLMFNVGPKEYQNFSAGSRGPNATLKGEGSMQTGLNNGRNNALVRAMNAELLDRILHP